MAGGGVIVLAVRAGHPWFSAAGVFAFYIVEAQAVFLFPLLLDGSRRPVRDCLRWTRRAGGTIAVMRCVMRLAATMLFGGFAGRGFVRSWALGCAAVCIWYERLREKTSDRRERRLHFASGSALRIRIERLSDWQLASPLRVLYISDLHLGRAWTRGAACAVVRAARTTRPDVILLGGDLLDRPGGGWMLRRCVRLLARLAPVYAVAGNHDHRAGLELVRGAILSAGARWLEHPIRLEPWGVELVSNLYEARDARRTILCGHDPSIFPDAARAGIDLVLAGHLHGGQCVLFQRRNLLYPGAWFARWTGLRFFRGSSTMLVSRGAADTLPVRWNCPREALLCEIC